MNKTAVESYLPQLNEEYITLEDKIIDGTITKEEVRSLYDSFGKISGANNLKSNNINFNLKDLNQNISKGNLHKFVSQLIEVKRYS